MQQQESIIDKCKKEMLSELIIPLQAKIEILEEVKTYDKADISHKLTKLYQEINKLREEYFNI